MKTLFLCLLTCYSVVSQTLDVLHKFNRDEQVFGLRILKGDSLFFETGDVWLFKNDTIYELFSKPDSLRLTVIDLRFSSISHFIFHFNLPEARSQVDFLDIANNRLFFTANTFWGDSWLYEADLVSGAITEVKRSESAITRMCALANGVAFCDFSNNFYVYLRPGQLDSMRLERGGRCFLNYDSTFTIISNTSISIVDLRRHSEIPILEMPTSGGSENGQIGSRYFFDQSIESKNQFRSTLSYYDFRSRKAYFNVISKDNAVLVDFFIDKNGAMHIYFCDVPYPYSGRYEYPNIVHHEIYDTNSFELIRRDLDLTRNGWYPFW